MKTTLTHAQLVARLEYASTLCSWLNVHDKMKPAMVGLIRRGLAVRRSSDEALMFTDEGHELLEANKHLITSHWQSGAGLNAIVEGAQYWLDQWNQKIPK